MLVDLDADAARAAVERAGDLPPERPPLYGDGHAGERVVAALEHIRSAPRLQRG